MTCKNNSPPPDISNSIDFLILYVLKKRLMATFLFGDGNPKENRQMMEKLENIRVKKENLKYKKSKKNIILI